jgi:rod shape-determining protein MreC
MSGIVSERRAPLLLLLVLALLLGLMAQGVRSPGEGTLLQDLLRRISSPVVTATWGVARGVVARGVGSVWHSYLDLRGARAEAAEARRERDEARALAFLAEEALRENRRLRRLLELRDSRPDPGAAVAARVVGRAGDLLSDGLLIDRGARDGIETGQPVVAAGGVASGVVGRVVSVSGRHARVQLLTDRSATVAVRDQDSRAQGIVRGQSEGQCVLTWIDLPEALRVGSLLVSSGMERVYPPGVPVAVVQQRPSPDGTEKSVPVRPILDLGALDEVLVLPRVPEEEPLEPSQPPPESSAEGGAEPGPASGEAP